MKINLRFTLTKSVEKFINRFRYIEKTALGQGEHDFIRDGQALEDAKLM